MKVSGSYVRPSAFDEAEKALSGQSFTLRDFADVLTASGVASSVSYEAAKRHLQNLRRSGDAAFNKSSERWRLTEKTVELDPEAFIQSIEAEGWQPVGEQPEVGSTIPLPASLLRACVGTIALLTCLVSIGALVFINATFAWEFAETPMFQYALVAAFMACDLLRPLLVARGVYDLGYRRFIRGFLGILVAISLAPLSVLSSTTVLSATMQLGAEQNEQSDQTQAFQERLADRYDAIQRQVIQLWQAHEDECARGGCGTKAQAWEEAAKAAETEAQDALAELGDLQATATTSSFTSRTVQAFVALGLFSREQIVLLPLAMALTLELAALFGPALLLARRTNA